MIVERYKEYRLSLLDTRKNLKFEILPYLPNEAGYIATVQQHDWNIDQRLPVHFLLDHRPPLDRATMCSLLHQLSLLRSSLPRSADPSALGDP